jgi:hypothetical protein
LSLRSPCSYYVGNQQEARFVGKDDVGAQPSGVFLCAASPLVSNVRSRLHRAPAHAAPVSAESIPCRASGARYGPDGSGLRTRVRPSRQCAPCSTDGSGNPAPPVPSEAGG